MTFAAFRSFTLNTRVGETPYAIMDQYTKILADCTKVLTSSGIRFFGGCAEIMLFFFWWPTTPTVNRHIINILHIFRVTKTTTKLL